MKKEILLLSSLISFALVFYFGLPNKKNTNDSREKIEDLSELNNSLVDEILNEDVLLKFDLVRLDPSGDVIIAGKTEPEIKIDIFDGNEKLLVSHIVDADDISNKYLDLTESLNDSIIGISRMLSSSGQTTNMFSVRYQMAFNDIAPRAPVHVLIIPKKEYNNYHDFTSNASHEEIIDIYNLINSIIDKFELKRKGYRIITNTGDDGNQEVRHLHFHLLGGKNLGIMIN